MTEKTHYRKAFNSPYLSSADIVGPTVLTVKCVKLEPDKSKKSKDFFNTAYFAEKELRQGEPLKPMILNAVNSRMVRTFAQSAFIDDWNDISITVYVDPNVRFGRDTVEGLRISPEQPNQQKREITPQTAKQWANAKTAYIRDQSFDKVLEHVYISADNMAVMVAEVGAESNGVS